jgi:transposase
MSHGYSLTAAAGAIGLSRELVYRWSDEHPDFNDAVEIGKCARVYSLERDLLYAPNATVVRARIFALRNAAPHEWQDNPEVTTADEKSGLLTRLADELLGSAEKVDEKNGRPTSATH